MSSVSENFLRSTRYLDWDHPSVIGKVRELTREIPGDKDKAVRLFDYVRDAVPYTPFIDYFDRSLYIASNVIKAEPTYCIPKAILLAAMARGAGIPSRLRFAFIRNRQLPQKLKELLQEDVLYHHGFAELYINGRWVRATVAYDSEISARMNVPVVVFDGIHDATLPSRDLDGNPHVEYLEFSDAFDDGPEDYLMKVFTEKYGHRPSVADDARML